jgi:hypothetical protein
MMLSGAKHVVWGGPPIPPQIDGGRIGGEPASVGAGGGGEVWDVVPVAEALGAVAVGAPELDAVAELLPGGSAVSPPHAAARMVEVAKVPKRRARRRARSMAAR